MTLTVASLAALVLAPLAAGLRFAPSFEKAGEVASASGRLVMVVVVAEVKDPRGRNPCRMLRERTLADPGVRKLLAERFVPFVLDLDKVKAGRQAMPEPLKPLFKPGAFIRLPMVVVCAPGGEVVAKLLGYLPPADFAKKLRAVPANVATTKGQPGTATQAKRPEEPGGDELGAAMDALEAALGGGPPGGRERQARAAFQRGLALEKRGKIAEAIALYRKLIENFPDTHSAAQARKRLARLRSNPPRR